MPVLEHTAKKLNSEDWNDGWTAADEDDFDVDPSNFDNFSSPPTSPKVQVFAEAKPKPVPETKPVVKAVIVSEPVKTQVIVQQPIQEKAIYQGPEKTQFQKQEQEQNQQPSLPPQQHQIQEQSQQEKPISKPPTTKGAQPKAAPKQKPVILEKCANNFDCQEDQFCVVKVGKCVKKFDLGAEGCAKHEQCSGKGVACVQQGKIRRCIKACKTGSDSTDCGDKAYCTIDKGAIKGLKGGFTGICKSGKAPVSGKEMVSSAVSKGNSSGVLVPLTIVAGVLLVGVFGFLWLRSWMKKRNTYADPKLFIFKHTKAAIPDERLDNRLLKMPGAKYTVWAPTE